MKNIIQFPMLDLMSYLTGGGHRIKLKRHEYIRAGLVVLGIFIIIALIVMELKYFNNTFGVKKLVMVAIGVGALLGGAASYWITHKYKDLEILLKLQIWVALIVCSVIVMPVLASFVNRSFSFSGEEKIPVTFVATQGFYADRYGLLNNIEPDGYFIFILKDGKLQRLKTKTNPFPDSKEDEVVLLPVRKGFFGFEYVKF